MLAAALLIALGAADPPAAPPAAHEAAALVENFAAALALDDQAALNRIALGGITDPKLWRTALDLIGSYDSLRIGSATVVSVSESGGELFLDVILEGTGMSAGGNRKTVALPRRWRLDAGREASRWVLKRAATAERLLAEELATADASKIEAALKAAPDLDVQRFSVELADCASEASDAGAAALAWVLASSRRRGDHVAEGQALRMYSYVELISQRLDSALRYAQEALAVAERAADADEMADANFSIAVARWYLGELPAAIETFRRSGADLDALDDPRYALRSLYMAAVLEMETGSLRGSLLSLSELERHLQKYPSTQVSRDASALLGAVHHILGNAEVSKRELTTALDLARQSGDRGVAAETLGNLAIIETEAGDRVAARRLLEKAVVDADAVKLWESVVLFQELGAQQMALGELSAAEASFERALERARRDGEPHLIQRVLARQSALRLRQGRPQEALALAQAATEKIAEVHPRLVNFPNVPWLGGAALGRALVAVGRPADAERALRAAILELEEAAAERPGDPLVAAASSGDRSEAYRALVDLLVARGQAFEALVVADRMRAQLLRDALESGRVDFSASLDEKERQRETELEGRLVEVNRALLVERDDEVLRRLTYERDEARFALQRFRSELYALHPTLRQRRLAVEADPRATWERSLPVGGLAIEFVLAEQETLAFLMSRRVGGGLDVEVRRLGVGAARLGSRVEALETAMRTRDPAFVVVASELYKLLVEPLEDVLRGRTVVCFIPDGVLWRVPFQVLRDARGEELVRRVAMFRAPSLASLTLAAAGRLDPGHQPRVLALGNPEVAGTTVALVRAAERGPQLGNLPDAEREVLAISRLYGAGRGEPYTRREAREKLLKEQIADFDVVHLATHGLLDDQAPLFSALLLAAKPGDGEDGLLEVRELADLDLSGKLVVLSACETGRGRVRPGEGVVGMSWALMAAGSPAAVVSDWKADSAATSVLMIDLHRRLLAGDELAVALQQAQLSLRRQKGYSHPYYWAPFSVVGIGW